MAATEGTEKLRRCHADFATQRNKKSFRPGFRPVVLPRWKQPKQHRGSGAEQVGVVGVGSGRKVPRGPRSFVV